MSQGRNSPLFGYFMVHRSQNFRGIVPLKLIFSYRYMLSVLEEIPDLKEIELHLHIFANGREEEEDLRKQTELLPRVTELIGTVLFFLANITGKSNEDGP